LDAAHPEILTVTGVPTGKASDARSLLEGNDYVNYDVGSNPDGSLKMTMKAGAIRTLEQSTLDHSIETIRERLSPLGVTEPLVAPYGLGNWEVLVEMPNVADPGKVEDAIKSTSKLAVYPVVGGPYQDEQAALAANNGAIPPEDVMMHGSGSGSAGAPDEVYVLQRASIIEGNDFRDAQPSVDQEGRPNMTFTLTTDAGNRFYTYTSAHSKSSASPGSMAIVLGGKVKEVAAIDSSIRDRGEIHGSFTKDEVQALSLMLRTGAIPASI